MVLLQRRRSLFARQEDPAYTAEPITALVANDGLWNLYDPIIQADIEMIERPSQGSFSFREDSLGPQMGTCTFRADFSGDGAGGVPVWADAFFPACGLVRDPAGANPQRFQFRTESPDQTVPTAALVKTLTMYLPNDGIVKGLRGAAGTFQILLETGMPTFIEFTFTGVWIQPFDDTANIPAVTYPANKPLRFANDQFQVGTLTPCVQSVTIDPQNEVTMRECQSASDGSGYRGALITGRNTIFSANPEADLVANQTFWADWIAQNRQAATITLSDAADTVTFTMPQAQIINDQEGDRNGIVTEDLTLKATADTADNDFFIEFAPTP